jgi:hypothetical protein
VYFLKEKGEKEKKKKRRGRDRGTSLPLAGP